jgi:glutathionylspermidine synthase
MSPLRCTGMLSRSEYADFRESAMFDCCKWDPQVEDVSILTPFALTMSTPTWQAVSALAEQLATECAAAETELATRTDLHHRLGLSGGLRHALRAATQEPAAECTRFMRFDFHWTTEGWRISEVNSDVPGGFNEAAGITRLMARHWGGETAGDPAQRLAVAVASGRKGAGPVALVHATAYSDDRQVMTYLGDELSRLSVDTRPLSPEQLKWRARCATTDEGESLSALLRFYPAEWLPSLSRSSGWEHFFTALTPAANPPRAILTQCKRWPLAWNELNSPLATWRKLLPECRDPKEVDWRRDPEWVIKPSLGRVGEGIGLRDAIPAPEWRKLARSAAWFPRHWVAQRRFQMLPVETPLGPRYPALGVYVVSGRAVGIYARCSPTPLIDHRASDVAVLLDVPVTADLERACHVGT